MIIIFRYKSIQWVAKRNTTSKKKSETKRKSRQLKTGKSQRGRKTRTSKKRRTKKKSPSLSWFLPKRCPTVPVIVF